MIQLLPAEKFKKIANELESNRHSKDIDSWTHLITMLFYHLSNATSCRDISNGLMSIAGNINNLGCKHAPSKSSVSYINKHRDYRLFEKFFLWSHRLFRTAGGISKKKPQAINPSGVPNECYGYPVVCKGVWLCNYPLFRTGLDSTFQF